MARRTLKRALESTAKQRVATKPENATIQDQTAAKDILQRLPISDHQAIIQEQLEDPVTRDSVTARLLSLATGAAAHSRLQAEEACESIKAAASKNISKAIAGVCRSRGCQSSSAWPQALYRFLPPVKALLNRGSIAEGPEYAWEALLHLAKLCILPEEGSHIKFQEGEEECDDFHEKVDRLMLQVCEAQEKAGKTDWLNEDRMHELTKLGKDAGKNFFNNSMCSEYRYRMTLKFLKNKR